jgi:hypothetical protein
MNNKITCTVTFYDGPYGMFMQAWALQKFLGESNFILNFSPRILHRLVGERGKQKLPFFWRILALWRYLRLLYSKKSHLNMLKFSKKYSSWQEIVENPPNVDVYIVGSDQVWNCTIDAFRGINFLAFVSSNAKRISYAASMGAKEWPPAFTQQVLPYLKKFHAISVREESSVPFLESIGLEKVAVTCDPAILWTADVYRSNFSQAKNKSVGCIFVYRINGDFTLGIKEFLKEKKYYLQDSIKHKKEGSTAQWLCNIDSADTVITDSFHGIVFSILFHKQFAFFPISLKIRDRTERLISLLRKVKLEYRLLSENATKEEIDDILYRPIDWEQVDKILEEWRTYSANWLRQALDG